jgi:hypothetical protein
MCAGIVECLNFKIIDSIKLFFNFSLCRIDITNQTLFFEKEMALIIFELHLKCILELKTRIN